MNSIFGIGSSGLLCKGGGGGHSSGGHSSSSSHSSSHSSESSHVTEEHTSSYHSSPATYWLLFHSGSSNSTTSHPSTAPISQPVAVTPTAVATMTGTPADFNPNIIPTKHHCGCVIIGLLIVVAIIVGMIKILSRD